MGQVLGYFQTPAITVDSANSPYFRFGFLQKQLAYIYEFEL